MMLLDSWNPIFRVRFTDAPELNEEFETREAAIDFAKSHLEVKPIVEGLEILLDDLGTIIEEAEAEEIYSYLNEAKKEEEPEVKLDRLAELEAELAKADGEVDIPAEAAIPEQPTEVSSEIAVAVASEEPTVEVPEDDPYNFVGDIKVDEAPCVDPFACDFSDVSKDEAMYSDVVDGTLDPTVFLQELANELGIGDEVVIKPAEEVEIPEVSRVELIDNHYDECPECEGTDKTFDCDFCDFEEPKTELVISAEVPADVAAKLADETPVKVELPVEAETAAVSEEPVATEAPCEGENCDPHCVIEEPAKEISDCHVCPTCGKEICECGAKELTEETEVSMETVIDEALEHFAEAAEPTEIEDPNSVEKALSEFVDSLDESTSTDEPTEDSEIEKSSENLNENTDFTDFLSKMMQMMPDGMDLGGDLYYKLDADHTKKLEEMSEVDDRYRLACEVKVGIDPYDEGYYGLDNDIKAINVDHILIRKQDKDNAEALRNKVYSIIDEIYNKFKAGAKISELEVNFEDEDYEESLTEDSEMEKHKAIADKFRASLEVEESLEEEVDIQKLSYNRAEDIATKENKPVIYGVSENGKFNEIAPVICNDIKTDTAKVKANYADVTVYVAYPGKDFAESLEDTVEVDLSDDRTPVEETSEPEMTEPVDGNEIRKFEAGIEEEEMSDLELAERLEAAKKEKYSEK